MSLKAVIFDLDGVLTDTAEYHYLAWKRLADEEGLPFDRTINEQLRGVSRRESLQIILDGRAVDEATREAWMARKNGYYQEMLGQVSPADLLVGVADLLAELDGAGISYAVASASKNAAEVVDRLGIGERLAVVADGHSVLRPKPAPDLFRHAAARLNLSPDECLVVEDAGAGIEAAVAAGMPALAVGPADRFAEWLGGHGRVTHRPSLAGITLADLQAILPPDETWVVAETGFDPARQHHMETVFTLGNGYFANRGSLEEGFAGQEALTLAHGIFDDVPIVFTELVNLPAWFELTLKINGQRFRLNEGQLRHFSRTLDQRQAILQRHVRWQAPDGTLVDISFERLASYARPHVGGLRVIITAVNQACHIELETGINGHVSNHDAGLKMNLLHWQHLNQGQSEEGAIWLHSRTQYSGVELCTAATLTVSTDAAVAIQPCAGQPHFAISQTVPATQSLVVEKLVSYTASRDAVDEAVDVVGRARAQLAGLGYGQLRAEHVAAWAELWRDCDVIIEGDDEAQLAIRFNLFQLLVAAPQQDERASIGAKTLSGMGYRGHVFWDTEIFMLPFFTYARPQLTRNMLMYRYHTLAGARRKAAANGFRGAQYAWESAATGDEVTPTWVPDFAGKGLVRIWTGDIEIHISADIAYAIYQYWQVTGDDGFLRDYGAEMILDTARFWASRAELEEVDGVRQYAYRDVIGPDEYHDHVDNNVFTNRMAQWHLQTALDVLGWLKAHHPAQAGRLTAELALTEAELAQWRDVIAHVIIHHDQETGLMVQFDDFFERRPIDPDFIAQAEKSLQVILGIEGANESQILKQADAIMLLCLLRDEYDQKTWQTNWETYMPITDHQYGSSLGPSFHAWAACEMNRPDEAYVHFMRAARADLRDVRGNAGEGIHAASAGGLWQAVAFGFAGLRLTDDGYTVTPRLPAHWRGVSFKFYHRGEQQVVVIRP